MRLHLVGLIVVVAWVSLLSGSLAEGIPDAELENNIEWFGINLGGGPLMFNLDHDDYYPLAFTRFGPQADLLLFNLNFPGWYLTPLEIHPVFFLGFLGGGTRAGVRLALSDDRRHELRLGSFAGVDGYLYHINTFAPSLVLKPHAQYLFHTSSGSIGVGVDFLLLFHFRDEMLGGDGHTVSVPPVAYGASVYLRWTIGRSAR